MSQPAQATTKAMTIPEIKQLCKSIIELADKATPGPWEAYSLDDYGRDYGAPVRVKAGEYDVARNGTPGCFLKEYDASFIAAARNVTPQMAKALLTCIEALEVMANPEGSSCFHTDTAAELLQSLTEHFTN